MPGWTEDQLEGNPDNDPECVEYWVKAKDVVARGNKSAARKYARMLGVSEDEIKDLSPQEMVGMYKFR